MAQPDNDIDSPGLYASIAAMSAANVAALAVPVVTAASAYSANNVVGGLLTFNGMPGGGLLKSAHIKMASIQTAEFDLYLFSAIPNLSTWTDKTAPAINAGDVTKCIGCLKFLAANANSGLGTHTIYNLDGIEKLFGTLSTTLYGVLVTKGTPTFTATTDILGVTLVVKPH